MRTSLIAKDRVQDVANVATPQKEDIGGSAVRRLVINERHSRRIADGVEESRRKRVNRREHGSEQEKCVDNCFLEYARTVADWSGRFNEINF